MSQTFLLVLQVLYIFEHNKKWISYSRPITTTGDMSEFFVFFYAYLRFFERNCVCLLNNKIFWKFNKLLFSVC